MAIEIKELIVKFKVEDSIPKKDIVSQDLSLLERRVVNKCVEKVLRVLESKFER